MSINDPYPGVSVETSLSYLSARRKLELRRFALFLWIPTIVSGLLASTYEQLYYQSVSCHFTSDPPLWTFSSSPNTFISDGALLLIELCFVTGLAASLLGLFFGLSAYCFHHLLYVMHSRRRE